jgi:putative salt-induced outer membrane protein YdiY
LTSGERLVGEVLPQSDANILILKSAFLGELKVQRAQIVRIEAQPEPAVAEVAATPQKAPAPLAEPVKAVPSPAELVEVEEESIYKKLRGFEAPDSWKGNLRMGMNISSGDKQWTETALRGSLEIKEKGSQNFYRVTGSYTYRETERSNGDVYISTDRYDGTFTYRRSLENDWFFQNALGARADKVKGIEHEIQDTIGIGYRFRPIEKFEILVGGGGGVEDYQTRDDTTRDGFSFSVMNVFEEMTWRPFERTSVVQKLNYYWNPEDSEQYNYIVTAALQVRLTDLLGLEFSYNQNYDNDIGNGKPKNDAVWRNALIVYF